MYDVIVTRADHGIIKRRSNVAEAHPAVGQRTCCVVTCSPTRASKQIGILSVY